MSDEYGVTVKNILADRLLTCSMKDGYDYYQNALAERISGILKGEFLLNRPQT